MAGMETDRSFLESKTSSIFSFDRSIRFVVLLTSDGKPVMSVGRAGVTSLEPQSESDTVYVKASIAMNMSAPMNKYFGPLRTVVLIREKVMIICFSLAGRIMLISADPAFQLQKVEPLGRLIDELNIS